MLCLIDPMVLLADIFMQAPARYRRNVWFMHDGTPALFSYVFRNYLKTAYSGRWIGRQRSASRISDSPDVNYIFPLGTHNQNLVYDPAVDAEARYRWMYLGPQHFRHFSMHRRAEDRVAVRGQHVEHVL
jgi:hypothetical protein